MEELFMIEFVDAGNGTKVASYILKNGKATIQGLAKISMTGNITYDPLTEVWKIENENGSMEINNKNIFKATFENDDYVIDVKEDKIYAYETIGHYVDNL